MSGRRQGGFQCQRHPTGAGSTPQGCDQRERTDRIEPASRRCRLRDRRSTAPLRRRSPAPVPAPRRRGGPASGHSPRLAPVPRPPIREIRSTGPERAMPAHRRRRKTSRARASKSRARRGDGSSDVLRPGDERRNEDRQDAVHAGIGEDQRAGRGDSRPPTLLPACRSGCECRRPLAGTRAAPRRVASDSVARVSRAPHRRRRRGSPDHRRS